MMLSSYYETSQSGESTDFDDILRALASSVDSESHVAAFDIFFAFEKCAALLLKTANILGGDSAA